MSGKLKESKRAFFNEMVPSEESSCIQSWAQKMQPMLGGKT